MGSLRFLSRTNLGGNPRLFYINLVSEPNPISPFNNQNHDWQPTATLTIRNNSTARHAITQILTPRDLQTNTTQFLTSQNLQTRARTSLNHIPPLATRILHPKTNRKAYYFPKTCDPNLWSTLRTTTRSETENINSTQKKKKFQIHNFKPPDWEQESWKPTIKRRSPPTEWRHRTTHRRYAVTFAPTMPLHGFRDMTHQVRSLPSSAADSHCRWAQPSLRRRLQRCFVLCFAASSLLVSLCFSSFGV